LLNISNLLGGFMKNWQRLIFAFLAMLMVGLISTAVQADGRDHSACSQGGLMANHYCTDAWAVFDEP
jgi:hypothetical protein